MKSIPLLAFGIKVFLTDADETVEPYYHKYNESGFYSSGHYFFVAGLNEVTIVETGEKLPDRVPGWLSAEHNHEPAVAGTTARGVFKEPTQWLCIPKAVNPVVPEVTKLILLPEETVVLDQGVNLYLVKGVLQINDRNFIGPTEIRVRSGEVLAASVDESFSLYFPKELT